MSSDTAPPVPPSSRNNSFFHQAATASAWMPLALFVGQIFLVTPITASIKDPFVNRLLGIGMGCGFLLGLALGIVALCGIPKYGTKGLLTKGIIGIAIPLLLILCTLPVVFQARELALRHHQQMLDSNPNSTPTER